MKMTAKSLYVRVLKEIKCFYKTSDIILNVINSPFLLGFFRALNRCLPRRFNYEYLISITEYEKIVGTKKLLVKIDTYEKLVKMKKLIKEYGLIWTNGLPIIKDLDEKYIICNKNLVLSINTYGFLTWSDGLDAFYYTMKNFVSTYELITLDEFEERLKNIRDKINNNLDKILYEKYKYYLSYYKDTVINDYKKYYN